MPHAGRNWPVTQTSLKTGDPMIKYIYPDGTHCYRALHTTHAVFRDENSRLIARAAKADGTLYEFEIASFELLEPGVVYD